MFDSLMVPTMAKGRSRIKITLPIAVLFHVALACILVAHALLAMPRLSPPPLMLSGSWLSTPRVSLPKSARRVHHVAVVKREDLQKGNGELQAPPDTPDTPIGSVTDNGAGIPSSSDLDLLLNSGRVGFDWTLPGKTNGPATRVVRKAWEITPPKLKRRVNPAYPPAASAMGLEGSVVLELVVNEKGLVESARVVSSTNPIFEGAALSAVRRWTFTRPIDRKGQEVACYLTVTVTFALR